MSHSDSSTSVLTRSETVQGNKSQLQRCNKSKSQNFYVSPRVLLHKAFSSQPPFDFTHSLISLQSKPFPKVEKKNESDSSIES